MPFVSEPPLGLLDTNVVVHAFANDANSEECARHLRALRDGRAQALVEPVVLHELTYVLPQFVQQMARRDVSAFLLELVGWEAVRGDKPVLVGALERWRDTPGLGFVDAYLAALATRRGLPVYTKNIREFARQRVNVPNPLPT